jgi:phage tail protein X
VADIYTTSQDETVDIACYRFYGRTAEVTEAVLDANPGLAAIGPILPFATQISMPAIEARSTLPKLTSLWD